MNWCCYLSLHIVNGPAGSICVGALIFIIYFLNRVIHHSLNLLEKKKYVQCINNDTFKLPTCTRTLHFNIQPWLCKYTLAPLQPPLWQRPEAALLRTAEISDKSNQERFQIKSYCICESEGCQSLPWPGHSGFLEWWHSSQWSQWQKEACPQQLSPWQGWKCRYPQKNDHNHHMW